jgi:hypothetical protein
MPSPLVSLRRTGRPIFTWNYSRKC